MGSKPTCARWRAHHRPGQGRHEGAAGVIQVIFVTELPVYWSDKRPEQGGGDRYCRMISKFFFTGRLPSNKTIWRCNYQSNSVRNISLDLIGRIGWFPKITDCIHKKIFGFIADKSAYRRGFGAGCAIYMNNLLVHDVSSVNSDLPTCYILFKLCSVCLF